MNVPIRDREEKVEQLRLALTMSGVCINYITVDLVYQIFEKYQELGGDFSIRDSAAIETVWEAKWEAYAKSKENKSKTE